MPPPTARQPHRCDEHLEDVISATLGGRGHKLESLRVFVRCLSSRVGNEPERVRFDEQQRSDEAPPAS